MVKEVQLNTQDSTTKKLNQAGNINLDLSNQQGTIYDAPKATYMGDAIINNPSAGAMQMQSNIFSDPYSIVDPSSLFTRVDTINNSIDSTYNPSATYQSDFKPTYQGDLNSLSSGYEGYLNFDSDTTVANTATYADDLKNITYSDSSNFEAELDASFETKTGELSLKETAKHDLFDEALGNWFTQDSKELLEEVSNMKDEDIIALADAYEKKHGGEPEALIRTIQSRIRSGSQFRPDIKRLIKVEEKLIETLSKSPKHAGAALSAAFGCIGTNDRVIEGVLTNIIENGDLEKMSPSIFYAEELLGKKLDKGYIQWQCFSKKGKKYLTMINAIKTGSKEYYEFTKTIDNFGSGDVKKATELIDKMKDEEVIKLLNAYDAIEEKLGALMSLLDKKDGSVFKNIIPISLLNKEGFKRALSRSSLKELESKIAEKITSDPTQCAYTLYAAMKGMGKKENVSNAILDKLTKEKDEQKLLEIMSIYSQIAGETLSKDIRKNYRGKAEKKYLEMFKELKRKL